MREILFRGKSVNDYWIYGNLNFYPDINRTFIRKNNKELLPSFQTSLEEEVSKNTIGQYTGLTDKNGKKIFEGDIIKSCEYDDVYFVEYCADDNYPAFDVVPEMNIECNGLSHLHIVEGIEVIGNIHDNPELLKEREGE